MTAEQFLAAKASEAVKALYGADFPAESLQVAVTRKEFETCYIGNPVLLIKPDKQGKEIKLYLVD